MITSTKPEAGAAPTLQDERRLHERSAREVSATVRAQSLGDLSCRSADISEGGMFVCTPKGASLMVGERCEVLFDESDENCPAGICPGEAVYGTVVRTESGGADVGLAIRFDQPLFL